MKFLVATDFSDNSLHAVKYAANLAVSLNAEVILLNAFNVMPVGAGIEEEGIAQNMKRLQRESRSLLKETVEKLHRQYPVFGKSVSRQGFASEVTQKVADEIKPDLVVAGRRGQGAVSRAIFGSVSSRLIESQIHPLLIVPEDAPMIDFDEVVFLSDFHDSDIANLKFLVRLMKPFNPLIKVIHFHSKKHEDEVDKEFFNHFEGLVKEQIRYSGLSFMMKDSNDLNKDLQKHIQEKNVQLLAVASMHRTFWQQLVDPSLTKQVMKNTHIPILIFEAHDEDVELF